MLRSLFTLAVVAGGALADVAVFKSLAQYDGFVTGAMPPAVATPGKGLTASSTTADGNAIRIGDTADAKGAQYGFVSFLVGDLGGAKSRITGASFTLTLSKVYAKNPLTTTTWFGKTTATARVTMVRAALVCSASHRVGHVMLACCVAAGNAEQGVRGQLAPRRIRLPGRGHALQRCNVLHRREAAEV
jgi:hypothetical protein